MIQKQLKILITVLVIAFIATVTFGINSKVFANENAVAKIGEVEYNSLADAVAAVPTDNTETTILLLKDVEEGGGFVVNANQNLIIDFDGHTYDASIPTVGSTGTETNGCQLLMNSKVTFKNGSLTTTKAAILVQNYCELTLENMNLYASNSNCEYIVSNNFGSLTVKGNTNITAVPGNVAFDLWYGLNGNGLYDDGLTVKFGKDFTGTVTGKIEYGAASRITTTTWTDKVKLIIEAGKFDVSFAASSTGNLEYLYKANIRISGGNFKSWPLESFIEHGYEIYEDYDIASGNKEGFSVFVCPHETITIPKNTIALKVGESAKIEYTLSNEEYKKFVGFGKMNNEVFESIYDDYSGLVDENAITFEDETITAVKPGAACVAVGFGEYWGTIMVVVFESAPEELNSEADKNVNEILAEAIISAFESEDEVTELLGLTEEEMQAVGEAIMSGKNVTAEVTVSKKTELTNDEKSKIETAAPEGTKLAGYFEINVTIKADGEEIANIRDLGEKVALELTVPENLEKPAEGLERTFIVLRIHNGKAEVVAKGIKAVNGKVPFEADKFSTYALAYEDTAKEETKEGTKEQPKEEKVETKETTTSNPKTGDYIIYAVVALVVATIGMGVTIYKRKHSK